MIKTILFDLDGTLLPMDNDKFMNLYFSSLAKSVSSLGYLPDQLISTIWKGTKAMILNDGKMTNKNVFWDLFSSVYGSKVYNDIDKFDQYCNNEFSCVKEACWQNRKAIEIINLLKEKNIDIILATNPIFPEIATANRIKWAGLKKEDFKFITTYENSSFSKPNILYYKQILKQFSLNPEECLMVGNDAIEDMAAQKLNIKVFLLTDCLLNKKSVDISSYPQGNFDDLYTFLKNENVL